MKNEIDSSCFSWSDLFYSKAENSSVRLTGVEIVNANFESTTIEVARRVRLGILYSHFIYFDPRPRILS